MLSFLRIGEWGRGIVKVVEVGDREGLEGYRGKVERRDLSADYADGVMMMGKEEWSLSCENLCNLRIKEELLIL